MTQIAFEEEIGRLLREASHSGAFNSWVPNEESPPTSLLLSLEQIAGTGKPGVLRKVLELERVALSSPGVIDLAG
jgi:hypothetical protein